MCQVDAHQIAASLLEIDTSAMDQNQKMELEELVQDFAGVFSTGKQDLGHTDLVYHSILQGMLPMSSKLLAGCRFTTNLKLASYLTKCHSRESLNPFAHLGHPQ